MENKVPADQISELNRMMEQMPKFTDAIDAKLSELQRMILVALMTPEFLVKSQPERNAEIYRVFFDCDPDSEYLPAAQASLSRACRRLEKRGLIRQAGWQLTEAGTIVAALQFCKLQERKDKESENRQT